MVDFAGGAVVAAADFAVAEFVFEGRGYLEVGAHFEDAVEGRAGGGDGEGFFEAGEVDFAVLFGLFGFGHPGLDVGGFDNWSRGFDGFFRGGWERSGNYGWGPSAAGFDGV